jgi:hypothetical protein
MLDQILIFTRCGVVLWSKTFCKLKDNPIEEFISTVIIPEKSGEHFVSIGSYALKWVLSNTQGMDLIFVVQYLCQISFIQSFPGCLFETTHSAVS